MTKKLAAESDVNPDFFHKFIENFGKSLIEEITNKQQKKFYLQCW